MEQIKYSFTFTVSLIFALFFQTSCDSNKVINAESVVHVSNGQLIGIEGDNNSITVFKGIPYAAPPVGNLRWQPPQPPVPWEGVRNADEFCKSCIQNLTREYLPWTKEYMLTNDVDEDCLALNIWSPATKSSEKLPVLVYIHGGAYTGGSGEVLLYDGESLAAKGIIVVTINYRLGILGFFAHPQLTEESPNKSSGNYGLLDQIAALKWIKQNIDAFGGDSENVTISGQSAGAHSINVLTASPLAKGLFHKAIAQSGPLSSGRSTTSLEELEQRGMDFTDTLGNLSIAELRIMTANEIHAKSNEYNFRFGPNLDGWLLPDEIANIYANGNQNDVPMLTGFNADEASARPKYGKLTIAEFEAVGKRDFADQYEKFMEFYPANTDEEVKLSQIQQMRDAGFANMLNWSKMREQTGTSSSFKYYFERATPWPEHPNYKAFHSSEVPYVFGNQRLIERPWESIDLELSELMSDYWVNFIRSGDPNGDELPVWPSGENQMIRLGESTRSDIILDEEKFDFYISELE